MSDAIGVSQKRPAMERKRAAAYANGMFNLTRAVSVLWTSADLAMWRLRLALFDESR